MPGRLNDMKNHTLINDDGEVRELLSDDFKNMQPAADVLPQETLSILPKRGRPIKSNPKKQLTIRLNGEIIDFFKAHGRGWQTEINDILQKHVNSNQTVS